jgi:hypothetical protein
MGRTDDVGAIALEVHADFLFAGPDGTGWRRLWHNLGTGSDDDLLADHNLVALAHHRWHHHLAVGIGQRRTLAGTLQKNKALTGDRQTS